MKIRLYHDRNDDMPAHEFDAHESTHITEDAIIHWAPTDQHYVYFDTDGESYISFALASVVTVNVSLG